MILCMELLIGIGVNMKKSSLEKITKAIESEIDAFGEVMDVSKFKELQKQLEKFLTRDALTSTLNRWKFEDVLKREISRAKMDGSTLCLLMLDIDKFKRINDGLGHNKGDEILKAVVWDAEFLVEGTVGKSHRLGRWGGDEFLYILPSQSITETKKVAEVIRSHVEGLYVDNIICRHMTVSIGVAHLKKSDDTASFINRADKAMYRAKKKGGDKVEVAK